MARSLKETLGISELSPSSNNNIYRALLAEFFGIFILNFFGVASCASNNEVVISLAFGLTVYMAVSVSKSQINI